MTASLAQGAQLIATDLGSRLCLVTTFSSPDADAAELLSVWVSVVEESTTMSVVEGPMTVDLPGHVHPRRGRPADQSLV